MFIEEAKMSARLNHPNIVQVFELGSVDSEYFISMEYVRGRDLAETMHILVKVGSSERCGRIRLTTNIRSKPAGP